MTGFYKVSVQLQYYPGLNTSKNDTSKMSLMKKRTDLYNSENITPKEAL